MLATIREHYQRIGALLLVIGVALVTIAEMPSMHWVRVVGAGALTLGAVGVGVWVGASRPKQTAQLGKRLAPLRTQIAVVIVVLTFLPALIGLAAGIAGLASGADGTGWVMAVGTLILILLLVATIAALAITVQAIMTVREGVVEPEAGSAE